MKMIPLLQIEAILNYLRNTYVYVNSIYLCLRKQGSHFDNNSKSTYNHLHILDLALFMFFRFYSLSNLSHCKHHGWKRKIFLIIFAEHQNEIQKFQIFFWQIFFCLNEQNTGAAWTHGGRFKLHTA